MIKECNSMKESDFRKHPCYLYAKDIVEGREKSGKYIKKECARFLDLVDNTEHRLYQKYFIDLKRFKQIDNIVKLTNFATGEFAGQPCYEYIKGFQWYILMNIYCIYHTDRPNKRRYEKACVFISRKNAKTWLVSMFMILAMLFEPDYAQLVAAANTRDQAKILFAEIKKTLEVSPKLAKYFKILSSEIKCKRNNNTVFPIAAEARTTDGMLVSVGCVDEYGAAKDSAIYDSLQTSMLATVNRLLFTISTGYPYPENPMREQIDYGKRVLDGIIEDDRFFLMCYELDEGDHWTDEKCWIKSNPLQAKSELGMEFLRGECKMALELPSKQVAFRTKNLNQWLNGDDTSYVTLEQLEPHFIKEEDFDFTGKDVIVGIDLGRISDNTGISIIHQDKNKHWYIKSWAIIPKDEIYNKSKLEKIDYESAINRGEVFAVNEKKVKDESVVEFVKKISKVCNIQYIMIDKWDMENICNELERYVALTVDVQQNYATLDHPTTKFKEKLLNGEISLIENKVLKSNFLNCVEKLDSSQKHIMLNKRKNRPNDKIDMVASIIDAVYYFTKLEKKTGSGLITL